MNTYCEECKNICYDDEECNCPAIVAYREKLHQRTKVGLDKYISDLFEKMGLPKPRAIPNPLPQPVVDKFQPYDSIYELTLTIDKDDVYQLLGDFNKIVKSRMFEIKGYIACIELTQSGLPHLHALLFSSRKTIDASKIKKLYQYRYSCKKVRLPGNFYEYINKERHNATVQGYCDARNVPQIWDELIY